MYTVTITDTTTGISRIHRVEHHWEESSEYLWSEGNFSCDCNRGNFFTDAGGEERGNVPCGDSRYRVVISDGTGDILYNETGS